MKSDTADIIGPAALIIGVAMFLGGIAFVFGHGPGTMEAHTESAHSVYVCVDRETGEPTLGAGMNLANVTDFDCATVRVPRRQ